MIITKVILLHTVFSRGWLSYLGNVVFIAPNLFLIIWLSNSSILSISDESYSCALNLIFTFLLEKTEGTIKYGQPRDTVNIGLNT